MGIYFLFSKGIAMACSYLLDSKVMMNYSRVLLVRKQVPLNKATV